MTHLTTLAQFVARTPGNRIPPAAITRAGHALIDVLGVTIAGSVEPVSKIIARHVAATSRGSATVITGGAQVSAADGALANATAGHALDFDDSNFVLGEHPTVTLMPALLAVAEELGSSGREILEAYVIGFEVATRLAQAVHFEHYKKGWHPTATLGVFGAAAAVARLLRLTEDQVLHALALAASMASGVKANFGSMAKPLQVGHASRNGVLCAQLAAAGFTANPLALEGKQGFFEVYNGAGHYRAEAVSNFGDELEIMRSGLKFKKYPSCGSTHAPIDAALDLIRGEPLRAADVDTITIAMNQRRITHVNRPKVSNGLEGKFSIQYTLAAALADGAISLRHFNEENVARPELQQLVARVNVVGVPGLDSLSQQCGLTVRFKDGSTRSVRREDAEGRDSDEFVRYLEPKFVDCVEQAYSREHARALFRDLEAFETLTDIRPVMRKLAGAATS
ncbi:MAG: MmgE/PrpD family protein [Betaproteobacteria bacterium]|nr:MmgE/PrpD family protein [Betaproteobacteria bacterium]